MSGRFIQISKPGSPLQIVERDIPKPGPGQVRVKVEACGVCHSDALIKNGAFPNFQYPRVPGHEIAGIVDEVGENVVEWKRGERVGVGWHGGHCGKCENCLRGDFFACIKVQWTGITFDGGYADYVIVPSVGLAKIPQQLSAVEVAPLMCAGVTTYNALRNSGARPGDVVAILGVGGLGHLGVQFAAKMGFKTIAIARGKDKEELALKLGAEHYIDSTARNPVDELSKLGGAKAILATVTNSKAVSAVLGGLGINGKLLVIGTSNDPIEVSPMLFITGQRSIMGWYCGTAIDSQDALSFCALSGIRSMNEVFPLEQAADAYDLMISGKARFRAVLKIGK